MWKFSNASRFKFKRVDWNETKPEKIVTFLKRLIWYRWLNWNFDLCY